MKTIRVFISPDEIGESIVSFSEKNSKYLKNVLRMKTGDEVKVFDGTREYAIRLTTLHRNSVSGIICDTQCVECDQPDITLAFGCIRPGPMQEILRHCTELGVSRFVPLLTAHCSRKPSEKKERWESTVSGASAQSGRSTVPAVTEPVLLKIFLDSLQGNDTRLLLSTSTNAAPFWSIVDAPLERITLLTGPEGGFQPAEEDLAAQKGFRAVSLGSGILRAETAAIVAVGAVVLRREFLRKSCESITF